MKAALGGLFAIALTACVGREIVGKTSLGGPGADCALEAPPCPADLPTFTAIEPVEFAPRSTACPDTVPCPASNDPDDWGGCAIQEAIVIAESTTFEDVDLSCTSITFVLEAGVTVTFEGAELQAADVTLSGTGPSALVMRHANVRQASIALLGDAYLQVENATLDTLRVDASTSVGPAVAVRESILRDVALRGGARTELHLGGGTARGLIADVGRFLSENSSIVEARIQATELILAGASIFESEMYFSQGTWVALQIDDSKFFGCDDLVIAQSGVRTSFIDRCSNGLVVEDAAVMTTSTVRGSVRAGDSNWTRVAFVEGPIEGVEQTAFFASTLCGVASFRSLGASLTCLACKPVPEDLCVTGGVVDTPDCPELEMAPACDY